MSVTDKNIPVACFAPPLTDELLAQYRALADALGLDQGAIRDAFRECLAAVEAWWELEESRTPDAVPTMRVLHRGVLGRIAVTPLEAQYVQELWDLVPWPYEVTAMQQLLAGCQADAARRNGELLAAWQLQIEDWLFPLHFPGEARDSVLDVRPRLQQQIVGIFGAFGSEASAAVDAFISSFLPGKDAAWLREQMQKLAAMKAEAHAIYAAGSDPRSGCPPKPALESTALRDAFAHLVWFCEQLAIDREPLTQDKLPVVA